MKRNNVDEVDRLMVIFGAFTRKVRSTWISPAKSRSYYEDLRRVFSKDGSPDGLYPACIVPQNLLARVVVIVPMMEFKKLLECWKKANPKKVKNCEKIVKDRSK